MNITSVGDRLKIVIVDNGKGFNVNTVEKGSGLINMKKRAKSINGELAIMSDEGKGSQVILKI